MIKEFVEYKSHSMESYTPKNVKWTKIFWTSVLAGMLIAIAGTMFYMLKGQTSHNEVAAGMFYFVAPFLFTIGLATLSYVGGDLLTSSFLYGGFAKHTKTIKWSDYVVIMATIFIGNLCGAIFFAALFFGSGYTNEMSAAFNVDFAENIIHTVETKMTYTNVEMFFRGFITNIFVCIGVVAASNAKSDSGKIFFNVMFVGFFVILGTEHVVANMGYFSHAMFVDPTFMVEHIGQILRSFFFVTLGHVAAGLMFGYLFSWQFKAEKKETKA